MCFTRRLHYITRVALMSLRDGILGAQGRRLHPTAFSTVKDYELQVKTFRLLEGVQEFVRRE